MSYTINRLIEGADFEQVDARVRKALADHGFGVLTEIDVKATMKKKINAAIYVGDCMEEDIDALCQAAGELGLLGVPLFLFQEGYEPLAEQSFREIARLTNGAYCRFDANSAQELRALLSAVAVYAAGGRKALGNLRGDAKQAAQLLLEQLN